jgi:hypothetical protein
MRSLLALPLALSLAACSGAPATPSASGAGAPQRAASTSTPEAPSRADREGFTDAVNTFLRARALDSYRGVWLPSSSDPPPAFTQHLSTLRIPGARTTTIECHRQNGWCLLKADMGDYATVDAAGQRFEQIAEWLDAAPLAGGPYIATEDDLFAPVRFSMNLTPRGSDRARLSLTLSTFDDRPSVSVTIYEP